MMAQPRGQLAIAHGTRAPAHRRLVQVDREFPPDPGRQIFQPPTHHAMNRRQGPRLDQARQRGALLGVQLRRWPRGLDVDQPLRPARVEAQYRIAELSTAA